MATSKKGEKKPIKKFCDFDATDISEIIRLGKEKYTLKEISSMLSLEKAGVQKVVDQNKIELPKKPNNIQRLYEQNKLMSKQFYIEATSLIKSRLMPDLIYKGYYRDGLRQISYNQEDVDDCYTYVMGKVREKYDPKLGTLATFIRNWVRGYGTTVTTAQHRRYNRVGNDASLDESYNNSIKEEFRDSFTYQELEDSLDREVFNKESLDYDALLDKDMTKLIKEYSGVMLKGLYD